MSTSRMAQLKQALEQRPKDAFISFAIAMEFVKSGDDQSALQHLLELLNDHPSYLGAYYHLASVYQRLNQTSQASETYKKGIALARLQGDKHALSELQQAALLLEEED